MRTRCPRCQTVLNVPIGAEGRKLKCPHCAAVFRVGDPGASARSSHPAHGTASPASSPSATNLPRRDEEPDLPVIPGDLRDQFDLPLLHEEDDRPAAAKPGPRPSAGRFELPLLHEEEGRPAPAKVRGETAGAPPPPSSGVIAALPSGPSPYAEADAAGLVEDDEPVRPRRAGGAEGRSSARRCPCGGVVPVGMSICPRCNLDLETGTRDTTFDLLDEPPPLPPPPTPFGVLIVGVTSALVGAGLTIASVVLYVTQPEAPYRWGYLLLAAVSAFGVFAAVRLLRDRSPRFLQAALLLGGLINIAALIILPIALASTAPVAVIKDVRESGRPTSADAIPRPRIVPLTERIDWRKINVGLAILGVTVVVAIYLNSPEVHRYARRR